MRKYITISILLTGLVLISNSCSDMDTGSAEIEIDPLDYPIDAQVEIKELNLNGIGSKATIEFDAAKTPYYFIDVYQYRSSGSFVHIHRFDYDVTQTRITRHSHPSDLFIVYAPSLGVAGREDPDGYYYRSNVIIIPERD